MTTSQIEVMNQARDLAERLASAPTPVKANTLRSILAEFLSSPAPDSAKLRRMLKLLEGGSGGHLKRSGNFPDQVVAAVPVLDEVLKKSELPPRVLKTLFGWTARLLLVRRHKGRAKPVPKRSEQEARQPASARRMEVDKFPPPSEWQQAKVSRVPETGALKAQLADGRLAEATAPESKKLMESLGDAAHQRLLAKGKRRKPVALEIRAAPLGRSWRIEAVREPPGKR